MKALEPIRLIDEVLNFIKLGERLKTLKVIHIHFRTVLGVELRDTDLTRILLKLQGDGYVVLRERRNYQYDDFVATYEGVLFHGYVRQKQIDDERFRIAVETENRAVRRDERLVDYTLLAGIVALLLLLWQIFLFYFPHYSDWPRHFWFEKEWINNVKKP